MKKLFLTVLALLAAGAMLTLSAQEEEKEITLSAQEEEKEMKTGWSFGLLPTATYSVDNGFQAGAFGDVYYYGDGGTYPDPLHKISWEASYFTHSHRMRLYLAYDSKYLVPNMRINASVTYMNDPLYSLWGFNGGASLAHLDKPYTEYWSNQATGVNYFGMSRNMLRVLANVQGRIVDHLNWAAGVNFWNWKLGDMKDTGYKAQGSSDKQFYNKENTLYKDYQKLGIINADEAAQCRGQALPESLRLFPSLHRHPHPHQGRGSRVRLSACLAADHCRGDAPVHDPEQSAAGPAQHDFRRLRLLQQALPGPTRNCA